MVYNSCEIESMKKVNGKNIAQDIPFSKSREEKRRSREIATNVVEREERVLKLAMAAKFNRPLFGSRNNEEE